MFYKNLKRTALAYIVMGVGIVLGATTFKVSGGNVTVTETKEVVKDADAQYAELQRKKALFEATIVQAQAQLDEVNTDIEAMIDAGYTP